MTKSDIDTSSQQFFDAGNPTPLRIGIEATLQDNVIKRIGDDVDLGTRQQTDELEGIGIVIGVHGGAMTGGDAPLPTLLDGIGGHDFGETRVGIIGFIAVTVNITVEFFRSDSQYHG